MIEAGYFPNGISEPLWFTYNQDGELTGKQFVGWDWILFGLVRRPASKILLSQQGEAGSPQPGWLN